VVISALCLITGYLDALNWSMSVKRSIKRYQITDNEKIVV